MKKWLWPMAVLLATLGALPGCGSDTGSGKTILSSCTTKDHCQDYIGSVWADPETEASCSPGTFSTRACPTEGRIGSCTAYVGLSNEFILRFYNNDSSNQGLCSSLGGTWSSD